MLEITPSESGLLLTVGRRIPAETILWIGSTWP
jgi:hypothetical protein